MTGHASDWHRRAITLNNIHNTYECVFQFGAHEALRVIVNMVKVGMKNVGMKNVNK